MSWKLVALFVSTFGSFVISQHVDGNDDGFFQQCFLPMFASTFPKEITDFMEITIVRRGKKPFKPYPINRAVDILKDPEFNISRKTAMFIHGYGDLPISNEHLILKAYLLKRNYNVLFLNSIIMLGDGVYARAASAVQPVGIRAGIVLVQMVRAGLNLNTFEIVGQSLGAHIAGYMGKTYFKSTGKKIPVIHALDPAGPCFRHASPKDRIDKSDALFVQVIHSNGGSYGLVSAVGHIDFYVNGGRWQPSEYGVSCFVLCSHLRPSYLWKAALAAPDDSGFIGVECLTVDFADKSNCYTSSGEQRTAIMGPKADPKINGIFYVRTSKNYPFYLGKDGTKPIQPNKKT